MKTQDFSRRLRNLADALSPGNDAAFARSLGLTPQTFHSYAKGRGSVPGGILLRKIAEKTGCSATWLLTGVGEMLPPKVQRSDNGSLFLPVLACASAASPNGVCMVAEGAEHYSARVAIPPDAHLIKVHGDSMFPVAENGQFVIVTDEEAKSGDLAVVETKDSEIVFKRISIQEDSVICISINRQREYEPIVKKRSEIRRMRKVWGVKF